MKYQKLSFFILRLGLAATYIYSGLDLILNPVNWIAFLPSWFSQLLPVSSVTYLQLQGGLELLLALGLIFGIKLRLVSLISVLEMVAILGLYGFDRVTFRDLAILGGSLAIFLSTFGKSDQASANAPDSTPGDSAKKVSDAQKRFRTILVVSAFILFSIILVGLFWLSNTTRDQAGWLAFSYATGLSMIVLPCTLPLAFVIVPLAMGKDAKKGLAIAIAFALGVTVTLSIYGAIIAKLGQVVGLDQAKDIMYTIAGVFAVVFGLGELGLIKLRVPTYSGAFPKFIQERKDVGKGFLLGLLLGNVGLGCPNPAFYVLLSHIATVGSMGTGWFLTFIHAVGRVTPLLLLAILAVLGVDALSILIKKKDSIARGTAWGVVSVGAFILVFGLLGHDWYVYSGLHSVFELVTREMSFVTQYAEQFGGLAHAHEIPSGPNLKYGSWLMVTLIVIPMIWYWRRRRPSGPNPEADASHRYGAGADKTETYHAWKWMGKFVITLSLLLYLLFGITLPNWFRYQVAPAMMHEEMGEDGHMEEGEMMHEENLEIRMNLVPATPRLNRTTTLEFQIVEPLSGAIITDLDISHGKPMHLVGVRKEDVGNFIHIHPELKGNKYVVNYTFVDDGTYVFWSEIVYQSHRMSKKMPELVVGTPPIISYLPALDKILKLSEDLVVQLKTPLQFEAGKKSLFGFAVTDSGGFNVPLTKYLEENMHITIVSQNLKHFHHLHSNYGQIGEEHDSSDRSHSSLVPFVNVASADAGHDEDELHDTQIDTTAFGPKDLLVNFAFPEPGLYKIFVEFISQNNPQVNRAEYWVEAKQASIAVAKESEPPSKLVLVVASLLLIGIVLPLIHKYLKEERIKAG